MYAVITPMRLLISLGQCTDWKQCATREYCNRNSGDCKPCVTYAQSCSDSTSPSDCIRDCKGKFILFYLLILNLAS